MARQKKNAEAVHILSYRHRNTRKNNPEVGMVSEQTDPAQPQTVWAYDPHLDPELQFDAGRAAIEKLIDDALASGDQEVMRLALEELKRLQTPYLNWSGKAERTSFAVDTVSLHVHERIDPMSILSAVRKGMEERKKKTKGGGKGGGPIQLGLFAAPFENLPLRDAIDFYHHDRGWANRLIAGDSLLVMNSLLQKEGMAGQVQMIYFDPPYGIKYGSNFQPFVGKRDVKDRRDEDLTQEPEMIKAFRDTWELGIHSYLTYLRDRLLLARELLHESGSVFVQISDENLHHSKEILDEVFGAVNAVSVITVRKTGAISSPDARVNSIATIGDFIVWYAKDKSKLKYRQLFADKSDSGAAESQYRLRDEVGWYQSVSIESNGYADTFHFPIVLGGREFRPASTRHWSTTEAGIYRVAKAGRVLITPGKLRFKKYLEDFPVAPIANIWADMMGASGLIYVVQTNERIIERCLLMTTDPGDLVLDPTCGSGTTAFVAEKWGRRWITCDTSRVAVTLAMQQQMDASIAAHADQETLYDQPRPDKKKLRISGPFTVEAVPFPTVLSLDEGQHRQEADITIARSGESSRQHQWRDELLKTGIRGKGGQMLRFAELETLPGTRYLHASGHLDTGERVVVSFGPEHAALEQRQVELALREAGELFPLPKMIVFCAFTFDPEAAKDIDQLKGITALKAQMNTDLLTEDLKKARSGNQSFWLMGQPDVEVRRLKNGGYQVEVHGFDYFDTGKGELVSGGKGKIAMWLLDTDYDERSLFPRQVFFPMAGGKDGWHKLKKDIRAELNEELLAQFHGAVSLPFEAGDNRKVAVKIVDDRGMNR